MKHSTGFAVIQLGAPYRGASKFVPCGSVNFPKRPTMVNEAKVNAARVVLHTSICANFLRFRVDFDVSKIPLNIFAGRELAITGLRADEYYRDTPKRCVYFMPLTRL